MSELSSSMFKNKADFLTAKADLANQEKERVTVSAQPGTCEVTRLVAGVELKLQSSGKHWRLSAKKK